MAASKAKRSTAAKKAARTRKRNKEAKRRSKTAKGAKLVGDTAEKTYIKNYLKRKKIVQRAKGIPDIINFEKHSWEYLEIKPLRGRMILNKNQQKMFQKLVKKGERVCMIYYTKKKIGHKKYKFVYSRKIPLKMKHFKSSTGHLSRHGIGPSPYELLNRKDKKKLGIDS